MPDDTDVADGGTARHVLALARSRTSGDVREALRSRGFLLLAMATALFVLVSNPLIVHLVPILRATGLDMSTAAATSALLGLAMGVESTARS